MNYQRIYDEIVHRRLHTSIEGYSERHHIIPKSLGGTDEKSNLVDLTAREHFLCHLLLTKIHKDTNYDIRVKVVKAFMMMLCRSHSQTRYSPSRQYSKLKEEFAKIRSVEQKGAGNSQHGTRWIHSKSLKTNKKIQKDEIIPFGWCLGRVFNWGNVDKICEMCFGGFSTKYRFCSRDCFKLHASNRQTEIMSSSCRNKRKIMDERGTEFNSLADCARANSVSTTCIFKRLKRNFYSYGEQ